MTDLTPATDMLMLLLLAVIIPIVVIGTVFLMQWVRKIMRDNSRQEELDSINHAQTISTLGDIATAGQAQTGVVTAQGTQAVSAQAGTK